MAIATVAAWIAWIFVIHSVDPTQAGLLGFLLFYGTLSIAVLGTSVLFGTLLRVWFRPAQVLYRQTLRSFRQGFLLTGLFVGTLFLFAQNIFHWWTAMLLMLLFILIELLFVFRKKA